MRMMDYEQRTVIEDVVHLRSNLTRCMTGSAELLWRRSDVTYLRSSTGAV